MPKQQRLTLNITLFSETHRANVLATLTVTDLIQEILVAFGNRLRFLNQHQPERYQIACSDETKPLAETAVLAHYLHDEDTLIFSERPRPTPDGATPLEAPFYLRYRSHVFPVNWQPALIGRPEPAAAQNNLLAVNLEMFSRAVSRQHAEIVEENGRWFIRQLTANPVLLNGTPLPFNEKDGHLSPLIPFTEGAVLRLPRSGIILDCLTSKPQLKQEA